MKNRLLILCICIWIGVSLWVRVVGLDKSPISLFFDEAGLGYNAYSLLLTGKDERGNILPVSIASMDYKPGLYSYLTVPVIKILGLNQSSTRIVSAVFGTLSLILLLLIFKRLSPVSWWTAFGITVFLSFLPWRLHYSRIAFEPNLSMMFFTASMWCLIRSGTKFKSYFHFIFFSVLAIYAYHASRLAIPLLFILYVLDPLHSDFWKYFKLDWVGGLKKLWPLIIIILLIIPILIANKGSSILRRLEQTNIFVHWQSYPISPLYYFGGISLGHLLSNFSPANLALGAYPWIKGSPQGTSGNGVIGWAGGSLLILGLWQWLKKFPARKDTRILLYWIIAGIAPAALTREWFHPLRTSISLPAIEIITGWGLLWLISKIRLHRLVVKLILLSILATLLVFTSAYNINNELNYGSWDTNGEFQPGGYKEGADLLNRLKNKYQTVYLDSPHTQNYILFLLYMNYSPERIQKYAATRPSPNTNGEVNFNFDNFVFKRFSWPSDKNNHNFAYWTGSEVKDDEINSVAGTQLYKIYNSYGRVVITIITKD